MSITKRHIDSACVLVNGLTSHQREEYLRPLRDSSASSLISQEDIFFPFCQGYLIGMMLGKLPALTTPMDELTEALGLLIVNSRRQGRDIHPDELEKILFKRPWAQLGKGKL
jgi:hypothetical protein